MSTISHFRYIYIYTRPTLLFLFSSTFSLTIINDDLFLKELLIHLYIDILKFDCSSFVIGFIFPFNLYLLIKQSSCSRIYVKNVKNHIKIYDSNYKHIKIMHRSLIWSLFIWIWNLSTTNKIYNAYIAIYIANLPYCLSPHKKRLFISLFLNFNEFFNFILFKTPFYFITSPPLEFQHTLMMMK